LNFQPIDNIRNFRADKRLTGSFFIDDELQEILNHILRDYVEHWYSLITDNVEFLFDVRQALQHIITVISNRCKEVDWLPFLTTRLVDNVATHIQIYREAHTRWKSSGSSNPENLDNIFFELELAKGRNSVCRRKICVNKDYEKGQFL